MHRVVYLLHYMGQVKTTGACGDSEFKNRNNG